MNDFFVYNNINSRDLGVYVKDYSLPLVQGTKFTHINRPYSHGSVRRGSKHLTDKFMRVDCGVIASDEEELQERISIITALLLEPGLLQMWDKPEFKYQAAIDTTTDVRLEGAWGEFSLLFRVAPERLGPVVSISPSVSPITISNPGTSDAYGLITITLQSNVNNLKVTQVDSGMIIYIDSPLVASDVIEINLQTRKIRKNGNLIMDKVSLSSDYFEIKPGLSTLSFSAGVATITFETRWV